MHKFVLGLTAGLALGACATTPAPIMSGGSAYPQAPRAPVSSGPSLYDSAPLFALHSELFSCPWRGSNVGEIGYNNESVNYSPYIDTPAGALIRDPTETACLSSGFGYRDSVGSGRMHSGLDLANAAGGYIYAAGDGRVVSNAWRGGYGNVVEIDHGRGVHTLYAHLSEADMRLQPGARVRQGQPLGRMGATGNATGVHLHYEVSVDGLLVDPLNYGAPPPASGITTAVTSTLEKPLN